MAKRRGRRAPVREVDPLDEYSTWNIRVAIVFFYWAILASLVFVIGVWGSVLGALMEAGKWEEFTQFDISAQVMIWAGVVVGHMFLLVMFYILFKGGKLRLLKVLFKDRKIAKKYEDYQTLRLLIAVTLLSVYVFIVALFIFVLPGPFFAMLGQAWVNFITSLNLGNWVLFIGIIMYISLIVVFIMFVLWNHGVFWVLKKVKRIEEEDEIKEQIKVEKLQKADEDTLHDVYHKETGKNAMYRGKETKGYMKWKTDRIGKE